jgi:hypothetical protein
MYSRAYLNYIGENIFIVFYSIVKKFYIFVLNIKTNKMKLLKLLNYFTAIFCSLFLLYIIGQMLRAILINL